ncbi:MULTISPECIES: 3-deoxy-manno-octulosonate cytidylyltransferase [Pectobacterium]|uniref:3-deoxy-manno-octulosonate cytidylyltransferase n=1 Tax=Pectobacterium TaxID=122277 RepID=UPI000E7498AB|nr:MULTISPECIES: 3-deoxy-manno-octulosonate cytidylyltransferase [Pectobacterium]RJL30198.1 3-deoxy-manno-octulosonate cytidylyltransferase [Pectobacterium polaris]
MQPSNRRLRVVIPARYGSTRLPGKPLVDLAGKPMIVRVYEAVNAALSDVDIVVAFDDDRIQAVLQEYGIPGVVTDVNHESGTDRTAEVARNLGWGDNDIIINVQGDEPLVPPDLLRSFAESCQSVDNFMMGTISTPIEDVNQLHDPNVVKLMVDTSDRAITFSRWAIPYSRDLSYEEWAFQDYLRHIGIYAYRVDVLNRITRTPPCRIEKLEKLEQLRALWLGIPIHVLRWTSSHPQGVDTKQDVERVVALLNKTLT